MSSAPSEILAPLLQSCPEIGHGFGTRLAPDPGETVLQVDQVHGDTIVTVCKGDNAADIRRQKGDALITAERGLKIGVRTADCLPLILYAPDIGMIATVHAGWRGTVKKIGLKVIECLVKQGASTRRMLAALGPCIGGDCYEVGPEVTAEFRRQFDAADAFLKAGQGNRSYLDITKANGLMLGGAGLEEKNIWSSKLCTLCHPESFHSFRRDRAKTGRLYSWIMMR